MNRRTFLSGLLALPVIGPALAQGLDKPTLFCPGPLRASDIIAAAIEGRNQDIADNVSANNPLLRRVRQDWHRSRPYAVGDEVVMGDRVLVCVAAGSTSMKRIEEAGATALPHRQLIHGPALVSTYIVDDVAFDEDHSRTLIRRMRREAGWRYRHSPSAWPFGNGLA